MPLTASPQPQCGMTVSRVDATLKIETAPAPQDLTLMLVRRGWHREFAGRAVNSCTFQAEPPSDRGAAAQACRRGGP
jgi:hypothetical protein